MTPFLLLSDVLFTAGFFVKFWLVLISELSLLPTAIFSFLNFG